LSPDETIEHVIVKKLVALPDFDELALTREQIVLTGTILVIFGLLELLASYFIASSVSTHRANAAQTAISQAQECQKRLTALGFQATVKGESVSAAMTGLDDAAYKLGQASIASLSCQGWELAHFCMGEGCGVKGVTLDLQPIKSR
jgi:hypothetical protein